MTEIALIINNHTNIALRVLYKTSPNVVKVAKMRQFDEYHQEISTFRVYKKHSNDYMIAIAVNDEMYQIVDFGEVKDRILDVTPSSLDSVISKKIAPVLKSKVLSIYDDIIDGSFFEYDDVVNEMENFSTGSGHDTPEDIMCSVEDGPHLSDKLKMRMGLKRRYIVINNESSSNLIITISQDQNRFITKDIQLNAGLRGAGLEIKRERIIQCQSKTIVNAGKRSKIGVQTSSVFICVIKRINTNKYEVFRQNRKLDSGTSYSIKESMLSTSLAEVDTIMD